MAEVGEKVRGEMYYEVKGFLDGIRGKKLDPSVPEKYLSLYKEGYFNSKKDDYIRKSKKNQ